MRSKEYIYIVAVELRHKATKGAIEDIRSDFDSLEYYISKSVRGKSVKGVYYRINATMHVYYDMTRRDRQDNELMRTVENAENELIQRIKGETELDARELKKYDKYFDVELSDKIATSYKRNYEKLNRLAKNHGFFCLLSNSDLSAAEVLSIYRNKDSIEKAFDEVKNYTDMSRLHTHNTDTTDGKLFCAFIALIATMYMQNKLDKLMDERNLTKEKIILELEKMTVRQFGNNKRQYAPLSKLQKDILSAFELSESDFSQYLQR
jgi:transposase